MGVDGSSTSSGDSSVENANRLVLEKQRVVFGRGNKSVEV